MTDEEGWMALADVLSFAESSVADLPSDTARQATALADGTGDSARQLVNAEIASLRSVYEKTRQQRGQTPRLADHQKYKQELADHLQAEAEAKDQYITYLQLGMGHTARALQTAIQQANFWRFMTLHNDPLGDRDDLGLGMERLADETRAFMRKSKWPDATEVVRRHRRSRQHGSGLSHSSREEEDDFDTPQDYDDFFATPAEDQELRRCQDVARRTAEAVYRGHHGPNGVSDMKYAPPAVWGRNDWHWHWGAFVRLEDDEMLHRQMQERNMETREAEADAAAEAAAEANAAAALAFGFDGRGNATESLSFEERRRWEERMPVAIAEAFVEEQNRMGDDALVLRGHFLNRWRQYLTAATTIYLRCQAYSAAIHRLLLTEPLKNPKGALFVVGESARQADLPLLADVLPDPTDVSQAIRWLLHRGRLSGISTTWRPTAHAPATGLQRPGTPPQPAYRYVSRSDESVSSPMRLHLIDVDKALQLAHEALTEGTARLQHAGSWHVRLMQLRSVVAKYGRNVPADATDFAREIREPSSDPQDRLFGRWPCSVVAESNRRSVADRCRSGSGAAGRGRVPSTLATSAECRERTMEYLIHSNLELAIGHFVKALSAWWYLIVIDVYRHPVYEEPGTRILERYSVLNRCFSEMLAHVEGHVVTFRVAEDEDIFSSPTALAQLRERARASWADGVEWWQAVRDADVVQQNTGLHREQWLRFRDAAPTNPATGGGGTGAGVSVPSTNGTRQAVREQFLGSNARGGGGETAVAQSTEPSDVIASVDRLVGLHHHVLQWFDPAVCSSLQNLHYDPRAFFAVDRAECPKAA